MKTLLPPFRNFCLAMIAVMAGTARADTYTFVGTSLNSTWTSANFSPNTGVPGAGDTLSMAAATGNLSVTSGTRTVLNLNTAGQTATQNILGATGGSTLIITGTLTKSNAGTFSFNIRNSGANSLSLFVNHLEYNGGGNLAFGNGSGIIAGFSVSTMNMTSGLFLPLTDNGGIGYIGSLNLSGGSIAIRNVTSGTSTLQIESLSGAGGQIRATNSAVGSTAILSLASTGSSSFSGTLVDGQPGSVLHVTKSGTGTQVLAGANTYTGTTSVTAGTLVLSTTGTNNIANSQNVNIGATGTLDVSAVSGAGGFKLVSGQTLTGSGTVIGALTVGNGATFGPGNSPGTMTFNNNLTLASGSISNFEINGLTSGLYDLAQGGSGSQNVAFDGTLNLNFQAGFATSGTIKVFDFETYSGVFSAVNTSGLASGYSASFNELTGEVTVVPEPTTWALLGLGLGVVILRARSRGRMF